MPAKILAWREEEGKAETRQHPLHRTYRLNPDFSPRRPPVCACLSPVCVHCTGRRSRRRQVRTRTGRPRSQSRTRQVLPSSRLEKSVPTLKNCGSWTYWGYLFFLCGLRLPVPARQTGGLCGKTETFGLNPDADSPHRALILFVIWPAPVTAPRAEDPMASCSRRPPSEGWLSHHP